MNQSDSPQGKNDKRKRFLRITYFLRILLVRLLLLLYLFSNKVNAERLANLIKAIQIVYKRQGQMLNLGFLSSNPSFQPLLCTSACQILSNLRPRVLYCSLQTHHPQTQHIIALPPSTVCSHPNGFST